MEDYIWTLTDVEVLEEQPALGKGAYGIVYSARWKGIDVAAKRVHEMLTAAANYKGDVNSATNAAVKGFEDESDTMQRLRHPHLVQFLGVYYDDLKRLHIVMEKLHESLADLLGRTKGPLFEMKIYSIGTDITSALRYMHELPTPIAHRDLTPKNILLTADLRAKVSDLGACKYVLKLHTPMTATLAPGNPKYMPPEALDGGRFAKYAPPAVDVYSLAIVLLEMFSGINPEPSNSAFVQCPTDPTRFYRVPEQERRSPCFDRIPKDHPLTELIVQCVDANHTQRPVMREIQEVLLGLQGKRDASRSRSKPLDRTNPPMKKPNHVYDEVSPTDKVEPHYENVKPPPRPPPPPPKGEKNPPRFSVHNLLGWQERLTGGPTPNAVNGQQFPTVAPPAYQQPPPPPPISEINPPRSSVDNHLGWQERLTGGPTPNAVNGQQSSAVAPPAYEPLRRRSPENVYDSENKDCAEEVYDVVQDVSEDADEFDAYDSAGYLCMRHPTQTRQRLVTDPISMGTREKFNFKDRASKTVHKPKEEEIETVLKVTEPLKKLQGKQSKSVMLKDGRRLSALDVAQNELLVTIKGMPTQGNMMCVLNTEGKCGTVTDAEVQLVKPETFNHTSVGCPGIIQRVTSSKLGTKTKSIQISSSKIIKGNLETLTSLANADVVAVDKLGPNANAFFKIDFLKHRLVRVEGYLLQWTRVIGRFGYPLRCLVEVSLDGTKWKMVGMEQQTTTTETSQYWEAKEKILGRYLRISLLGTNSEDNHLLCLSGIELYGDLYS